MRIQSLQWGSGFLVFCLVLFAFMCISNHLSILFLTIQNIHFSKLHLLSSGNCKPSHACALDWTLLTCVVGLVLTTVDVIHLHERFRFSVCKGLE